MKKRSRRGPGYWKSILGLAYRKDKGRADCFSFTLEFKKTGCYVLFCEAFLGLPEWGWGDLPKIFSLEGTVSSMPFLHLTLQPC